MTNAAGTVTHYHYDARGQPLATWGNVYPVRYAYDPYGRMTDLYTLRDASIQINSYSDFLTHESSFDRTRWLYDEATGLLTNKLYADLKGTAYNYTPDGKLATRIWARGITTTYSYTNTTGELIGIVYGDATPDVSFSLDRLGRQVSIADGQGTRNFGYDSYLALTNETVTAQGQSTTLARAHDALGRSSALAVHSTGDVGLAPYIVAYGFDNLGRFSTLLATNGGSQVANVQYSYLANSDLLAGWSNTVNGAQVIRVFEAHRDLLTSIENRVGTNLGLVRVRPGN